MFYNAASCWLYLKIKKTEVLGEKPKILSYCTCDKDWPRI